MNHRANGVMIGTGEYTTGYVGPTGSGTKSDKKCGVVALVMMDLRSRGKIGPELKLVGTSGVKFPAIRNHLCSYISSTYPKIIDLSFQSFPDDSVVRDTAAYITALDSAEPGDFCTIFTPDDTHFDIAMAAIQRGVHVMLTKPPVKTLAEHRLLMDAARERIFYLLVFTNSFLDNVLVMIEVHKRFDPVYNDARNRIRDLGDFGFFTSYMSQPKFQLETFKSWAGKSSDISYYLNSHHIDFHVWAMQGRALATRVVGSASTGVSKDLIGTDAEDTISLLVDWKNSSGNSGVANYTASWAASEADVHSQQRFFYLGHRGEISVDQAHRGYTVAEDGHGYKSVNPMYMRYTPDDEGNFVGQNGYGYRSFEVFVDAVEQIRNSPESLVSMDNYLPTIGSTLMMTAILEAGRLSLDNGNVPVYINYDSKGHPLNLSLDPQ